MPIHRDYSYKAMGFKVRSVNADEAEAFRKLVEKVARRHKGKVEWTNDTRGVMVFPRSLARWYFLNDVKKDARLLGRVVFPGLEQVEAVNLSKLFTTLNRAKVR